MASELLVSLSREKRTPGLRAAANRMVAQAAQELKSLPAPAQSFLKTLDPKTPLKIALERLAEEQGFDLTDPYAAMESLQTEAEVPGQGKFLAQLGKAPMQTGLTSPSR